MTKYIILQKAKPYIRYRRGKLEQVSGYVGRPAIPSYPKTRAEAIQRASDFIASLPSSPIAWEIGGSWGRKEGRPGKSDIDVHAYFLSGVNEQTLMDIYTQAKENGIDFHWKMQDWKVYQHDPNLWNKQIAEAKQNQPSPKIPSIGDFKQIGPQKGSQPGGLFEEKATGKKFYIKQPPTEEHARNEKLTADFYQLVGIHAPKVTLVDVPGGLGVASEWIEGLKQNPELVTENPPGLAEGYATDVWLANWDVIGTAWDNILLDGTGHAVRVDTGGGLKYRARGGVKPLDEKASEWESMREHRPGSTVFGKLSEKELIASGHRVMAIPDSEIQRLVAENGFGKDLSGLLIARKKAIGEKVRALESPIESYSHDSLSHLVNMVNKAIIENPGRITHGYTDDKGKSRDTGWSAFFVVGDKIYPYHKWHEIPIEDRKNAVSFHSHSPSNWKVSDDFQPLNSEDIHIWLKMFKAGGAGRREGIIMADGRMEVLELTSETDPALFKLGSKSLQRELHRDYAERAKYYDEHKDDPNYSTSQQDRELLRAFSKKYRIKYHEGLNWKIDTNKGITFYVIDLEKAKPYVRYRRGRLEHVSGYHKDRKLVPFWIDMEEKVPINTWKKFLGDKKQLDEFGYKHTGKELASEEYEVVSLGIKEKRYKEVMCDVLEHRTGSKIFVNTEDPPSRMTEDLTNWGTIFDFSKKWTLPDVLYMGRSKMGDKFTWSSRNATTTAEAETAGFADYNNNKIIVYDDHKGWWIFGHEMGHFVLNRLVKMADPKRKEAEKLVKGLGKGLRFVQGGSKTYYKGVAVLKSLGIPLDKPEVANVMASEVLNRDAIQGFKSREDVVKAYHDQGLEMHGDGYGAVIAVFQRMKDGKSVELSKEEETKLDKYGKIQAEMKSEVSLFTDWERIFNEEHFKGLDAKMNAYSDRNMSESFAEFYQLFTLNMFSLSKQSIRGGWEGLQQLKNDNPKKFKFFTDNVFEKEYKAYRKVARADMKEKGGVTRATSN